MRRWWVWPGIVLLWSLPLALVASEPDGNHWLQWRGPTRDGKFYGPVWPDDLSEPRLREIWRVPLDESYSGPVVTDDRVFTTETRNQATERVSAFDRATGQLLWQQEWPGAMQVPFFAASNGSWIRSTPACDGETLFVGGMRDLLVALDAQTGAIRWQFDFVEQLKSAVPEFGCVCSPLVEGDVLFVQAGQSTACLDKRTGKLLWSVLQAPAGRGEGAFSSPVFQEVGPQRLLFVATRQDLRLLDADDGRELAVQEVPSFRGMHILTPTLYGGGVFTSAHSGRGEFWSISSDADAIQLTSQWTNRKLEGYMSSPVVVDDHIYLLLKNQRFACFDLRTGEEKWRSRPYGKYWSCVVQGDRILALDERGVLLLLRANPEQFELLSERKISDAPTWAHLAAAGRELFVRELQALVAYRWE